MDFSQQQLDEFILLEAELNEKYHKYVTEDFVNQSDGILSDLAHGSAVKVLFAQKRLKAAIEGKRMSLLSAKNSFCSQCATVGPEKTLFCTYCRSSEVCQATAK